MFLVNIWYLSFYFFDTKKFPIITTCQTFQIFFNPFPVIDISKNFLSNLMQLQEFSLNKIYIFTIIYFYFLSNYFKFSKFIPIYLFIHSIKHFSYPLLKLIVDEPRDKFITNSSRCYVNEEEITMNQYINQYLYNIKLKKKFTPIN